MIKTDSRESKTSMTDVFRINYNRCENSKKELVCNI
jgi:hypothetical protein